MRAEAERPEVEASLVQLSDAVHATGDPLSAIADWWRRGRDPEEPWVSFAAVFALAGFDDPRATSTLCVGLEELGDEAEHARCAADALVLLRTPRERSLALDLLVRIGSLGPKEVVRYARAEDEELSLALVLVRAGTRWRATEAPALVSVLQGILAGDRPLALRAALALLRMGHPGPIEGVRSSGRLERHLGLQALELFVLAGSAADVALLEQIASRGTIDEASLSSLARFGHPGAWAFLVHHLADEDLADAAEEALRELFGDVVPGERRRDVAAWREAIARAHLDPAVRYRRGQVWHPSMVAAECASGRLTPKRVDARLAELAARVGLGQGIDLASWKGDVDKALAGLAQDARKVDERFPTGWG